MRAVHAYTTAPSLPRWREVLDDVIGRLEAGSYQPGGGFPTLAELCLTYGVSNITGRRVFSELKERGMIATRGRRGTIVTYSPRRRTVYLCFRDECFRDGRQPLNNYWIFHEILMGLASSDVSPLFEFKTVSIDFCLNHLDEFAGQPIIASADVVLAVAGEVARIDHELLARLTSRLQPIFCHAFEGLYGAPSVGIDHLTHGVAPVRHLVARGHRRLALLTGSTASVWFRPRFQGYLDAIHEAGLSFDPTLVRQTSGIDPAQDRHAIADLLRLPDPPTAVVCANDNRALAVLDYCREQGIRIPDDLAVTGVDNRPETAFSRPPLTTCDPRHQEAGRRLASLLARRLDGDTSLPTDPILIEPALIVRQSS